MNDKDSSKAALEVEITPNPKNQVRVHFVKSSLFRVAHASGVWFSGDAQQNLHLIFFNERSPIPKSIVFNLNDRGEAVGEDETKRESKDGAIREMEVDVVMTLEALEAFHKALGENLRLLKQNIAT